jgi:hypothetical protein
MKMRKVVLVVGLVMLVAMPVVATVQTIAVRNGGALPGGGTASTESFWMRSGDDLGINNVMLRVGYLDDGTGTARSMIRFGGLSHWAGANLGFTADQIVGARLLITTRTASVGSGDVELRVLGDSDEEWAEMYSKWTLRRTDLSQAWAGGGGAGSNYGSVVDTFNWHPIGGNPMDNWLMTFDITGSAIDVVKNWVSGNDTTDTFMLKAAIETGSGNNYLNMRGETDATISYRPVLEIDYDLSVPEPATMAILGFGGLMTLIRHRK